jgi:hypothetical protein
MNAVLLNTLTALLLQESSESTADARDGDGMGDPAYTYNPCIEREERTRALVDPCVGSAFQTSWATNDRLHRCIASRSQDAANRDCRFAGQALPAPTSTSLESVLALEARCQKSHLHAKCPNEGYSVPRNLLEAGNKVVYDILGFFQCTLRLEKHITRLVAHTSVIINTVRNSSPNNSYLQPNILGQCSPGKPRDKTARRRYGKMEKALHLGQTWSSIDQLERRRTGPPPHTVAKTEISPYG